MQDKKNVVIEKDDWRDTLLTSKIGPINAIVLPLIMPCFIRPGFWTFTIFFSACGAVWFAENRGHSPSGALRAIRLQIVGKERPARRVNRFRRWGTGVKL